VLTRGIFPFFERELRAVYGVKWEEVARASFRGQSPNAAQNNLWDAHAILTVMWEQWNPVFRYKMGMPERSLVSELRDFRNRWAHQAAFTEDDSYRVLDSAQRLLLAAGVIDEVEEIEDRKFEVLRNKLGRRVNEEQARVRFNRARMTDVSLYVVCCLAIITTMFLMWGASHLTPVLFTSAFTVFAFGFFVYQRMTATTPVYGVHECPKCSKVIYSEVCPYCDPPPRSSSIIKGSSSLKFPPFRDVPADVNQ
jgi:Swt1-like HEPN